MLGSQRAGTFEEHEAREWLEGLRWPEGPRCPRCRGTSVARFGERSSRPGLMKCRSCQRQFSVTAGTVLHGSHVPLRTWLLALCLIHESEGGLSAFQLQRRLGLASYQTAWSMVQRIRAACASPAACGARDELEASPAADSEGGPAVQRADGVAAGPAGSVAEPAAGAALPGASSRRPLRLPHATVQEAVLSVLGLAPRAAGAA